MAPEQALGRDTTAAADVFAWGATVAFAATGRQPFGEGRPDAVIYRVVHEEPDLLGIDARLAPLVHSALTKDPAGRPSADALLVGVVKSATPGAVVVSGPAAEAEATEVIERTWVMPSSKRFKPSGRQIAWATAALIIIAAFVGGALYIAHGKSNINSGQLTGAGHPSRGSATTTTTTASPTPTTAPPSPSIADYPTGQPNAGWPDYDLFTGNCSHFVVTYQYSWMGLMSAPTPISVPAGGFVQLTESGYNEAASTINVISEPAAQPLPTGAPHPQSDQAGVFVDGHDSLISYQCD